MLRPASALELAIVPLGLALLAGLTDLALGLARGEPGSRRVAPVLAAFAAATAAGLLCGAFLFGAALALRKRLRDGARALELSLAFVLACGWAACAAQLRRSAWLDLSALFVPLGIAALASPLVYALCVSLARAVARWRARPSRSWARAAGLARAALAAECALLALVLASPRLAAAFHAQRASRGHAVPRVVLIVVDTLRRDHLSCYSAGAPATPCADALAEEALVFDAARSPAPWTLPSMCSLLTGVSPGVHGALGRASILPRGIPTLAERLQAAGYRTAAFGRNAFLQPRSGLDRGFEEYTFFPNSPPAAPIGGKLLALLFPEDYRSRVEDARLTGLALEWIRDHADDDFLLWLHLMDPHAPDEPDAEFLSARAGEHHGGPAEPFEREDGLAAGATEERRSEARELYAGEVRQVDARIGCFLDELRRLGLYEDALVVLTSDHGEELWEHGGFEHGHSVYDEVLRVPLIVKLPAGGAVGRVPAPVSTESLAATVLDLCGVDFARELVARSLQRQSAGGDGESGAEAPLFVTGLIYGAPRSALVHAGHKYLLAASGEERALCPGHGSGGAGLARPRRDAPGQVPPALRPRAALDG